MLKYVSHFFLQIFPSVIATVVGAYIVNYYIAPKHQDAPKASLASTPSPAKESGAADTATVEPGRDDVTAKVKGSTDKAVADKVDKPAAEKSAAETKRGKSAVKAVPAGDKTPPVAEKPAVTVATAPPDAPVSTEEKRDANDLARAALDRLRGPVEASRKDETLRKDAVAAPTLQAPPRVQDQPRVTVASTPPQAAVQPQVQQQMQPLPPAVLVTTPSSTGSISAVPADSQSRRLDHARLSPPADIPGAPPLDLRAPTHESSITEEVVAKAKSVFDAVIPR